MATAQAREQGGQQEREQDEVREREQKQEVSGGGKTSSPSPSPAQTSPSSMGDEAMFALARHFLTLQLDAEDVPTASELLLFERRLEELHTQIMRKEAETRRVVAQHNAVASHLEFALKEISLLESIHAQCGNALTSNSLTSALVTSIQQLTANVGQMVQRLESKVKAKEAECVTLQRRMVVANGNEHECRQLLAEMERVCKEGEELRAKRFQL